MSKVDVDSLWEVNHVDAKERIRARRQRITKRLAAAKKLTTIIKIGQLFGEGIYEPVSTRLSVGGEDEEDEELATSNLVTHQCKQSMKALQAVWDNGTDLVSNVRLAADRLQIQHRIETEKRDETLEMLLTEESKETEIELKEIESRWPRAEEKGKSPTELYANILKLKEACNSLLEKKNDLIAMLEDEIRGADNQYKFLIDEYHENVSVLGSRMECQIQTLKDLVVTEGFKIDKELNRQRNEMRHKAQREWDEKLMQLDNLGAEQMEKRVQILEENEAELDKIIVDDAEAIIDLKHEMEENITKLSDQILFLDAVHQLNEERLDYEIHVLRKHEEEVVLVKSEQKRKITSLQDNINKLRQKVAALHVGMAKEEMTLHNNITDIQKQMIKLKELKRNQTQKSQIKREQMLEMVREEIMEKLDAILEMDQFIITTFGSNKYSRVDLYLNPLSGSLPKKKSSKEGSDTKSLFTKVNAGVSRSQSLDSTRKFILEDSVMNTLLSNLVHKANFLVEENLNQLVESDEITESEKSLFRLDSILTAIGVEGEEEIFRVLKRNEDSPSKAKLDVLKVIRLYVEQRRGGRNVKALEQKPKKKASTGHSSSQRDGSSKGSSVSSDETGSLSSTGKAKLFAEDWQDMLRSFNQFMDPDRNLLKKRLECLYELSHRIRNEEKELAQLSVKVREMRQVASKLDGRW